MDDEEEDVDELDDPHEDIMNRRPDEIPADTIVFDKIAKRQIDDDDDQKSDIKPEPAQSMEYYPNSTILRQPDPSTCAQQIAKQFEDALQAQLMAILNQQNGHGMG